MRVVVIRHGNVHFQWKKWSTSEQFNKDCKMYDEAPVSSLLSDVPEIEAQNIYISSLQRSRTTANLLFGDKDFICTKLIDEVPLCASVTSNRKLPLIYWNVSGRLQWLLNIHSQNECRKETVNRARQFVEMIAKEEKDCIVVTHGFFMHTLLEQMKKQGFHINHTRLSYANGECVIAER